MVKSADQAYAQLRSAVRTLYDMGNEVIALRGKQVAGERLAYKKSAGGVRKKTKSA